MSVTTTDQPHSRNLDCLRGIAVMLVIAAHLLTYKDYFVSFAHRIGLFGVMLFFIHTSLVLLDSLHRQARQMGGRHLAVWFLLRRIFRIYPASIFVVSVVWTFGIPVAAIHPGSFSASRMTLSVLASNLLLVQNLTHHDSILGPLWSLPFEMDMYLLLPILFVFVSKERTSTRVTVLTVSVSFIQWAVHAWRGSVPGIFNYVPFVLLGAVAFARRKLGFVRKIRGAGFARQLHVDSLPVELIEREFERAEGPWRLSGSGVVSQPALPHFFIRFSTVPR